MTGKDHFRFVFIFFAMLSIVTIQTIIDSPLSTSAAFADSWAVHNVTYDDNASSESPSIAVDRLGNLHVVWEDYRDDASEGINLYYKKIDKDGNQSIAYEVTNSASNETNPEIAVDSNGNAYVVWEDDRAGNADIYLKEMFAGGTVSDYKIIANEIHLQQNPSIAIDNSGDVHIAWEDWRSSTGPDIYYEKRNGSNLNVIYDDVLATTSASNESSPSVVVVNGAVAVVWQDNRNGAGNRDIYYKEITNGVPGASSVISNDTNDQRYPAASADPQGNIHVVWEDFRNGSQADVYYGKTVPTPIDDLRVTTNTAVGEFNPKIATGPSGNAFIVWESREDGNLDIYFKKILSDGSMGAKDQITTNISEQKNPVIAVDPINGYPHVYVAWQDYRDGNAEIYYAEISIPLPSVTGISGYNAPNPFNPANGGTTTIKYDKGGASKIGLYIYDLVGRIVYQEKDPTPTGSITWDGKDGAGKVVGNGVYLARIVDLGSNKLIGKCKIFVAK